MQREYLWNTGLYLSFIYVNNCFFTLFPLFIFFCKFRSCPHGYINLQHTINLEKNI